LATSMAIALVLIHLLGGVLLVTRGLNPRIYP